MLTQEMVLSLSSDEITKKKYDQIQNLITKRADQVWRFICEQSGTEMEWWAFSNDMSYGRGDGSDGGSFDPKGDAEFIELTGEYQSCGLLGYEYEEGFPTRFLWEEYEKTVVDHIAKCHEATDKKTSASKSVVAALRESIRAKLTPEEMKGIIWKQ
jgi:hypothetical protein